MEANEAKVQELLQGGTETVFVGDNDNEAWSNGWAHFLIDNFYYENKKSGLRAWLKKRNETK